MYYLLWEIQTKNLLLTDVIVVFASSNQAVDSSKGGKERKQGKKGRSAKPIPSSRSSEGLPDVGALCI